MVFSNDCLAYGARFGNSYDPDIQLKHPGVQFHRGRGHMLPHYHPGTLNISHLPCLLVVVLAIVVAVVVVVVVVAV